MSNVEHRILNDEVFACFVVVAIFETNQLQPTNCAYKKRIQFSKLVNN